MKRNLFLLFLFLFSSSLYSFESAILIDTSRSIPPIEFENAKEKAKEISHQLLNYGPVTVVSFNDEPLFEGKSLTDYSEVERKISSIKQGGRFTLLYDAIFKTLQYLEEKKENGIIVVISDGKDENSAVVLEDCAQYAQNLKIPLLTIGMGIEDKSLRRLPTLTKGSYLGKFDSLATTSLFEIAEREKERKIKELAKEEPKPKEVLPPPPPKKEVKGSGLITFLLGLLVVLLGILIVILYIMIYRGKKEKERVCEKCGRPLSIWEQECPNCFIKELSDTKPGVAEGKVEEKVEFDPELFQKAPSPQELDSTMVLEEIPVLLYLRGNQPPRMYHLSKEKYVSVGRDKINNICIEEKTLSGQHFRIVPKDGKYYLLDLQSTNGTFVDGERITYRELKHGSQISAGQCQFIFRIEQKRLN